MADLSFAEWLKRQRRAAGLTQSQLAQQISCSTITLRKIEAEERRPSTQMAERIAQIFKIPQDQQIKFLRYARGELEAFIGTVQVESWQESKSTTRSNLPATISSFIGREKEIVEVSAYLHNADTRLVTLVGPPGIGKTRLSIEVARTLLPDFTDGVFFIALAPLEDPALIPSTIVEGLDYVEATDQQPLKHLTRGIGNKYILLILDNCEHLINAVAPFVSELLSNCPRLKILATSRESLRIPGEWLYSPTTLVTPGEGSQLDVETAYQFPALALFVERARAVHAGFSLTDENLQAVAAICSRLDGLPLAIELLATRMRLMSPQALLERMTDAFILSADGMRSIPERQKTLNNAIRWSYNFLSADEKKIFESLSVFTGGFLLETVEAVFSGDFSNISVTDMITSLSDKSLLRQTLDANGDIRFLMLVTIQQFALEHLKASGDEAQVRNLHLAYFVTLAEQSDREFQSPRQVEWLNRIQQEHNNIRAALEWGIATHKTESALRLLGAMDWHWQLRGHYREARNWLDQIRILPDVNHYPVLLARVLGMLGRYYWTQQNFQDAQAVLAESLHLSAQAGNNGELVHAQALNWLGLLTLIHDGPPDPGRASALFEQGRELNKKHGHTWGVALGTFHLGIAANFRQDADTALSLFNQCLPIFQEFGDLTMPGRVSEFSGHMYMDQGDYEKALWYFEEHIRIDTQLNFWDGIADGLIDLGDLYAKRGNLEKANEYHEQCRRVCREHGLTKTINPVSKD